MDGRVVLVTGATTGIGLALARRLIRGGQRVVLTGRPSSLPRLADAGIAESERVWVLPLDVADPLSARRAIADVTARWGGVDVLINNAGVSYRAVIEHMSDEDEQRQMEVNFLGPMRLARLVIPGMRERRRGQIINISSVSGMMAMPTMGAYAASKFALEGATESLWYELRPWGVAVTLVQPGFVRSSSFERVLLTARSQAALDDPNDPYHPYYEHITPFVSWMMRHALSDADAVARRVMGVMAARRPRLRVAGTTDARLFYLMRRLLPRGLYHNALYWSLPRIRRWGPRGLPVSDPLDTGALDEVARLTGRA